jgi:hypothetical protein
MPARKERGKRKRERDGVLGHWQVGSRVLGPTDQRSTGIGEVRNISSQGFLERDEGLTNFFFGMATLLKSMRQFYWKLV